jgi:hypothetical protein
MRGQPVAVQAWRVRSLQAADVNRHQGKGSAADSRRGRAVHRRRRHARDHTVGSDEAAARQTWVDTALEMHFREPWRQHW